MMSLSQMALKTNYMMEQMRLDALNNTMKKWKGALMHYYTQGYDNGESTKLYNELIKFGANPEKLFDIDFDIRESVEAYRNSL